jgi:hypothetical protein
MSKAAPRLQNHTHECRRQSVLSEIASLQGKLQGKPLGLQGKLQGKPLGLQGKLQGKSLYYIAG